MHGPTRICGSTRSRRPATRSSRPRRSTRRCVKGSRGANASPRRVSRSGSAFRPAPTLFRFPYGTCSPETLAGAADLGLASIQWSIVTGDPDKGRSAQAIARAVRDGVKHSRGTIVVAHANGRGWHTAEALPLFVPQLRAEGYRFVTVSELLGAGRPVAVDECYEVRPGDNRRYDKPIGHGAGR